MTRCFKFDLHRAFSFWADGRKACPPQFRQSKQSAAVLIVSQAVEMGRGTKTAEPHQLAAAGVVVTQRGTPQEIADGPVFGPCDPTPYQPHLRGRDRLSERAPPGV